MYDLTDKIALVTGASRGIGNCIAKTLCNAGAFVMCVSRNTDEIQNVAKNITSNTRSKAFGFCCDISNTENVSDLIQSILNQFNKIDILVNNAGITKDALIIKMSENAWDEVINTNLKGAFNMTKAVAKHMMKNRTGRIINISSVIGITGNIGQINYAASKAGLIGMTKSTAKELASRNITVNCIAPGYIQTDMSDAINKNQKDSLISKIPIGRIGAPVDIASIVQFLASDSAGFITGQTITVDGGMIL
mgnify:CR=1 FL=1